MLDVYMQRFEHPYLLALVPIAMGLLGLSAIAQTLGSYQVAGFLALYAMVATIICVIGYTAIISLKYSAQKLQEWRIGRSGMD